MQDTDKESSTGNKFPYKVIIGYLSHVEDFETLQADPVYKEIMRVNTQLLERLRADYPNHGLAMDVSTVVEALPSEVF